MVKEKSWEEFRSSGLFWFVNTILHTFGWALVIEEVKYPDGKGGQVTEITDVYPARVKFRGFSENVNTEGYIKVSNYLKENIDELVEESKS